MVAPRPTNYNDSLSDEGLTFDSNEKKLSVEKMDRPGFSRMDMILETTNDTSLNHFKYRCGCCDKDKDKDKGTILETTATIHYKPL